MSVHSKITLFLEDLYPGYIVDSFKIKSENGGGIYVLCDIMLTGKPQPSPCGRYDGQFLPMIIAPTEAFGSFAGLVIKLTTHEEELSFDI